MADSGFISADDADRAAREPLQVVAAGARAEAPYFVDYISQELQDKYKQYAGTVDVYTTLDLHLQRIAQDAVRDGLTRVDELLAKRKRQRAQAALIAVDPRTGEILALVGGRSYNQSQYNRAIAARRQPGSVFKPFVYLAAFEHARDEGRTDVTPATVVLDEPTTFVVQRADVDAGQLRRRVRRPDHAAARAGAVAQHRAIKVAEAAGYDQVAALWRKVGAGTPPRPYPSIALGVFEATPFEIATAYTLFPNGGTLQPAARDLQRLVSGGRGPAGADAAPPKTVARQGHDLPRHQHDAQRASTKAPAPARAPPASRSTPPASPARPTICATPGSSASRRSC